MAEREVLPDVADLDVVVDLVVLDGVALDRDVVVRVALVLDVVDAAALLLARLMALMSSCLVIFERPTTLSLAAII
ncbi:hypothetical protein ACFOY2_12355 [Nonomuraea purpurea]|uniref:Uncharacterized protein n=1 Tax=Nonomuraea purpurea TaxID=1849276 RepID=A0ABV8G5U9_9ACTN